MEEVKPLQKRSYPFWSTICFLLCVAVWVPNIVFQVASPLFLLTFIIGPVGMILALWRKYFY